jgi:heme-degrading monooxygenase HmoA
MRFLLFDVKPTPEGVQKYLDIAAALRPELNAHGGCVFIDRFRDLDDPSWILSFQIWHDEEALVGWRKHKPHHAAQARGRAEVFADYRIRVGAVLFEKERGKPLAAVAPPVSGSPLVMLVESTRERIEAASGVQAHRFSSLYREGQFVHVCPIGDLENAHWMIELCERDQSCERVRVGAVERDYGMYERAQAPQAFAPIARK